MAATSTPTITIQGKVKLPNGLTKIRSKWALGANYASGTGVPMTAAQCGLTSFQLTDAKTDFVDPFVTGVNLGGILAEVNAKAIFLSYPTGGGGANPTTPAAPTGLAATGASTASAVDATRPTVAILPGIAKPLPDQSVTTGLIIFVEAIGYE